MRSPNSKFRVVTEGAAAPGAVCFNDLQGVVAWACSVRRTRNELGPKTYGVDGVAMPTCRAKKEKRGHMLMLMRDAPLHERQRTAHHQHC